MGLHEILCHDEHYAETIRDSMKASFNRTLLALGLSLWLGGCAVTGQQAETPDHSAPDYDLSSEAQVPVVYGQFSKDSLFALLTAEIAGQRNRFDIALGNYLDQARQTRDAGVTERALRVAEFLGAQDQALEMAELWVSIAPDNPEALRAAALHLARAGELQQAMAMMRQVLELHGETHFDFLALAAVQTDPPTRAALLNTLQQLLGEYPDNAQLVFAQALLLQQEERDDEALALFRNHPQAAKAPAAILLQSRLLTARGDSAQAVNLLQGGLREHPNDQRMRLLLARLLVAEGELQAAARQFSLLQQDNPDDPDLLLTLGLINLEAGNSQAAIEQLEQALAIDPDNNTARYHLGLAYEDQGQQQQALDTWQAVGSGNEFLSARLRVSQALSQQGRTDELHDYLESERAAYPGAALQLHLIEIETLVESDPTLAMQRVNQALQRFELDSNLLYTRALLAERLGQPDTLEADLRSILEREPDNAMALNALGYTLADRNERLEEALELIERAMALNPNDPAIIDSLGWVHFRLGNLELAEELLRRAYAAFPDQEVAAHLGEVLWVQGRQREARKIWDEALKKDPDSPLVRETRQRLEQR
mgnify:CR=1 FL=1